MKRLIITESQLKTIQKHILETIHPEEAYNDVDSVKTLLSGKRDVVFLVKHNDITKELLNIALKHGFKEFNTPQKDNPDNIAYVLYLPSAKNEAEELINIAKKYDGYLPGDNKTYKDITAKEIHKIGILLGYNNDSVDSYVKSKFPDYGLY